jgi:hypothetical protein
MIFSRLHAQIEGVIMATYQQVYLDEEAEQALLMIMRIANLNMSETLKQSLLLLQQHFNIHKSDAVKPFDIYKQLDLGEGGYAIAPASQAKEGVKTAQKNAWDVLETLVGSVEAPNDWSIQHDHYLYGIPKRQSEITE